MAAKELTAQLAAFSHGRVPRDLRRKQVLSEAFDLFIERGFPGASMDELARRVGVTKPVIYDLVGSKEQLFREVMAVVQEELTASIATAVAVEADLPSRLRAGILAFLRFTHQRRRGWSALLSMESGAGSAEVNAIRRQQASPPAWSRSRRPPRRSAPRRSLDAARPEPSAHAACTRRIGVTPRRDPHSTHREVRGCGGCFGWWRRQRPAAWLALRAGWWIRPSSFQR